MNDIDPTSVPARVARGIEFLDATQPGWRNRISLGDLDLGSSQSCILGQVFNQQMESWVGSGWNVGTEAVYEYAEDQVLELVDDDFHQWDARSWLGFEREDAWDVDYETLQVEWIKQLKA